MNVLVQAHVSNFFFLLLLKKKIIIPRQLFWVICKYSLVKEFFRIKIEVYMRTTKKKKINLKACDVCNKRNYFLIDKE